VKKVFILLLLLSTSNIILSNVYLDKSYKKKKFKENLLSFIPLCNENIILDQESQVQEFLVEIENPQEYFCSALNNVLAEMLNEIICNVQFSDPFLSDLVGLIDSVDSSNDHITLFLQKEEQQIDFYLPHKQILNQLSVDFILVIKDIKLGADREKSNFITTNTETINIPNSNDSFTLSTISNIPHNEINWITEITFLIYDITNQK